MQLIEKVNKKEKVNAIEKAVEALVAYLEFIIVQIEEFGFLDAQLSEYFNQ